MKINYQILKDLCSINACSGNEGPVAEYVIQYIKSYQHTFKAKPQLFTGGELQDAVVLIFGQASTAIFAHMDNIGFTVRYENEIVQIGSPNNQKGIKLYGRDSKGEIVCAIDDASGVTVVNFHREIDRGTNLSFVCNFRETDNSIQSCYLDNRMGVFAALLVAHEIEHGAIVFSCYEEHGGGSTANLSRWLWENYKITQALICDITWATDGVQQGKGVAISLRDKGIPRKRFLDKIIELMGESGIPYQLEVEGSGGSDGTEIQKSPYPIDWCFIGAPENNVHTPDEIVHKKDFENMVKAYIYLMNNL
ncbi:MAG: M20/M25/M40 family metallo-hydrolase [Flavobacteriales bacterium]